MEHPQRRPRLLEVGEAEGVAQVLRIDLVADAEGQRLTPRYDLLADKKLERTGAMLEPQLADSIVVVEVRRAVGR